MYQLLFWSFMGQNKNKLFVVVQLFTYAILFFQFNKELL